VVLVRACLRAEDLVVLYFRTSLPQSNVLTQIEGEEIRPMDRTSVIMRELSLDR